MLNKEKHQLIMGRVLRDLYTHTEVASLLGFKGGTCAYFFYALPRFSVDLDFDLLEAGEKDSTIVFETLGKILGEYGEIKDSHIKRNTIFFLLSYGDTDHNIKIEINTRMNIPSMRKHFELKEHLGISMLVGKKSYLFASKLVALTLRSETAMRDVYDIWYFAKNNWEIDPEVVTTYVHKSVPEHLGDCITLIEGIRDNQILQGLGELMGEKEKVWVRTHLREETIFLLRNYLSVLK